MSGDLCPQEQSVFWTESIKLNKPILQIKIKDKTFQGLIDTGADSSVISNQFWPLEWPLTDSGTPVTGVRGVSQPQISVWSLKFYGREGKVGRIQPYILPMPLNIWGSDLSQWGDANFSDTFSLVATALITPLPLTWFSNMQLWVDQWPLKGERFEQTCLLVKQLEAGHIEPSNSPWNMPIFVVPKKSGKWRLIHDLRKINEALQPMGPL